ncbi:MAG: hypothetical protein KAX49_08305, partial [Halanaerobiales bacterium]|nr:hypothetical protein [Halanaerobiales bacterium]
NKTFNCPVNLIIENQSKFIKLEQILSNEKVFIDISIFKDPREFELIKKIKPIFIDFLELFNFTEKEALNLYN